MTGGKMHTDEIELDVPFVARLVKEQFPQWAGLPLERVRSSGTDNALFRLGGDKVVRLPRIAWAVGQVEKEQEWLPRLAPHLPLAIPRPLAMGEPAQGYPWRWSVYEWLEGEPATLERLRDKQQAAETLAGFIRALQAIDATDAPPPGAHNFGRGVPLAERDDAVRTAIQQLRDLMEAEPLMREWERALAAPVYAGDPVWLHGDLQAGNLLAANGELRAVIDFGGLGAGDPACDLLVAWMLFDAPTRAAFREAMGVDEATWERGRGWGLSVAVGALSYYYETNPTLAGMARYAIGELLSE